MDVDAYIAMGISDEPCGLVTPSYVCRGIRKAIAKTSVVRPKHVCGAADWGAALEQGHTCPACEASVSGTDKETE